MQEKLVIRLTMVFHALHPFFGSTELSLSSHSSEAPVGDCSILTGMQHVNVLVPHYTLNDSILYSLTVPHSALLSTVHQTLTQFQFLFKAARTCHRQQRQRAKNSAVQFRSVRCSALIVRRSLGHSYGDHYPGRTCVTGLPGHCRPSGVVSP